MRKFLQQGQIYRSQQAVDSLNLLKLTLYAWKDVYPVDNSHTVILAWYTGTLFVFMPFKAELINYVEYYIPIKYVTKVKNFIGIGTINHRFKNIKGGYFYLPRVA